MRNPATSLFNYLLEFMERNRADNLHIKTGWHERLRAIYVHHHKTRQEKSGSNQPHLRDKHDAKK